MEAGAEYVVTQPVFDLRLLEIFLRRIEHCRIPVIAGIWPLTSVRNAEFMKNELRVSVPDSILERMARAQTPEAARAEGVAIAREMLHGLSSDDAGRTDQRADGTLQFRRGCVGSSGSAASSIAASVLASRLLCWHSSRLYC